MWHGMSTVASALRAVMLRRNLPVPKLAVSLETMPAEEGVLKAVMTVLTGQPSKSSLGR